MVNNRWFCGGGGVGTSACHDRRATACDPGFKFWTVGTHHDWFPLPGLRFAVDVMYTGIESDMAGADHHARHQGQGARPTGVYTVKDLGIVSAIFRAQRTWGAD